MPGVCCEFINFEILIDVSKSWFIFFNQKTCLFKVIILIFYSKFDDICIHILLFFVYFISIIDVDQTIKPNVCDANKIKKRIKRSCSAALRFVVRRQPSHNEFIPYSGWFEVQKLGEIRSQSLQRRSRNLGSIRALGTRQCSRGHRESGTGQRN